MTIYVDKLRPHFMGNAPKQAQRHGNEWCHLWTDSESFDELHAIALKIGLRTSYFQDCRNKKGTIYYLPHYDLTPSKRAQALREGAIEREVTELFAERKKAIA
jgi:Protein of unknown function (DUF4031)